MKRLREGYAFARYILETLTSPKATIMLLLNRDSHDEKTVSAVSGLFGDQIDYDEAGLHAIRLTSIRKGRPPSARG